MAKVDLLFKRGDADLSDLVDLVEEYGGIFEDAPAEVDIRDWLNDTDLDSIGLVIEDSDDPIHDLTYLLAVLKTHELPYIATTEAFEERSRGMRVLGRIIVNLQGADEAEEWRSFPWELGEPGLNKASFRDAGFTDEVTERVFDLFFGDASPQPRP